MIRQPQVNLSRWKFVPWGPKHVVFALATLAMIWVFSGGLLGAFLWARDSIAFPLLLLTTQASFFGLAWWYGPRATGASISLLGFRRAQRNIVFWALIAFWANILLMTLYALMVPDRFLPPSFLEGLGRGWELYIVFILVVLLAPITEESFFRGFVFSGLARRWGVGIGATGSSLLFALSHGSVGMVVPAFIAGVVLVWAYIQTDSLWPGILAHSAQNAVAFIMEVAQNL